MSYIQQALLPDERLVYRAYLHWIIYARGLFITIAGGLLGFYSYDIAAMLFGGAHVEQVGRPIAGAAFIIVIIGVVFLGGAYVKQTATELALTNRRIIAKYGFVARTTFEIMINRVTGANFDQTVAGRMLGYGTILVHGAGGDISPIDVVADPERFQKALMDVLEHQGQSRNSV